MKINRRYMRWRDFPSRRNKDGKRLCRWCRKPIQDWRRTVCGPACRHEIEMRTRGGYARSQVRKRDKGICSLCNFDALKMARVLKQAMRLGRMVGTDGRRACREALRELGFDPSRHWWRAGGLWDMDHITPVVEGGGCCGLEGLRTLCVPCHREVTRTLRQRLQEQRIEQAAQRQYNRKRIGRP